MIVKLLFLAFVFLLRWWLLSTRPTSLAIALAVSLLKMGDMIGLRLLSPDVDDIEEPFLPEGDSGGLELASLEEPNNLSWALKALLGLSSSCNASMKMKNDRVSNWYIHMMKRLLLLLAQCAQNSKKKVQKGERAGTDI